MTAKQIEVVKSLIMLQATPHLEQPREVREVTSRASRPTLLDLRAAMMASAKLSSGKGVTVKESKARTDSLSGGTIAPVSNSKLASEQLAFLTKIGLTPVDGSTAYDIEAADISGAKPIVVRDDHYDHELFPISEEDLDVQSSDKSRQYSRSEGEGSQLLKADIWFNRYVQSMVAIMGVYNANMISPSADRMGKMMNSLRFFMEVAKKEDEPEKLVELNKVRTLMLQFYSARSLTFPKTHYVAEAAVKLQTLE